MPMRTLVELKARCKDFEVAKRVLGSGGEHLATLPQKDIYFNTLKGHLKLRAIGDKPEGQLIYYEREDAPEARTSSVLVQEVPVEPMKEILTEALGIKTVVDKVREVYRFEGVQVHLDNVLGLGTFIEFEKMVERKDDQVAAEKEHLERLRLLFEIDREALVAQSYSDLLLASG